MTSTNKPVPISNLISLSGKRAVITGGATGLGYAMAYRFAEAGATVFIADIDGDKRSPKHGGAWSAAYRRLHDWRYHRMMMLESRKSNPALLARYQQLYRS